MCLRLNHWFHSTSPHADDGLNKYSKYYCRTLVGGQSFGFGHNYPIYSCTCCPSTHNRSIKTLTLYQYYSQGILRSNMKHTHEYNLLFTHLCAWTVHCIQGPGQLILVCLYMLAGIFIISCSFSFNQSSNGTPVLDLPSDLRYVRSAPGSSEVLWSSSSPHSSSFKWL